MTKGGAHPHYFLRNSKKKTVAFLEATVFTLHRVQLI